MIADKAAADKVIADKAAADKVAADKVIADKAAADKAAADKVVADAKAQAEADAAAAVAAAEKRASTNTVKINNSSAKSTRLSINLADKYYGEMVYVEVRTKTKTGYKTTVVDSFALENEDGTVSITTKKLLKGQILRVRVGETIVFRKTI
ncbi:unannotated protein [freshwater metagenome]|uniref:Unannotated protein n=1 Tax=freshwater metagenome TaxID=449393 RepID=A0A6J6EDT9_9ZZZZ